MPGGQPNSGEWTVSRRRVSSAIPALRLCLGCVHVSSDTGQSWFALVLNLSSVTAKREAARAWGPEPAGQVSKWEAEGWVGKQASFTSSSHLICQVSTGHGLHLP